MSKPAQGWRIRIWPWLVLALATLPAVWYVVDFESDIDPEFPRVVRPTFNSYPPPAYRFAEPGDTIDHIAVYVAAAAIDSRPADGRLVRLGLANDLEF